MRRHGRRTRTWAWLLAGAIVVGTAWAYVRSAKKMRQYRAMCRAYVVGSLREIRNALGHFYIDTGRYPTNEEGLKALVEKPVGAHGASTSDGPYLLLRVPRDPWGRDYLYRQPGTNNTNFDIICYGKDSVEGGEGLNKDITNHNLDEI